jgi:hypothetical protein
MLLDLEMKLVPQTKEYNLPLEAERVEEINCTNRASI